MQTVNLQAALALVLTPLALTPKALAQTPAAAESPTTTLTTRSTLVVVPALVRNKAGELVFTLKADDFTLTDDGIPQKLNLEQDTGGEPLALVLVIEGGGAGARELGRFRGLEPLLESVVGGVPHQLAVVCFDSSPVLVQDFTPNIDAAAQAVEALITDDSGDKGDAILDSLGFAVDLLRKQPPQYRRAILLLSETIDHGSHLPLDDALRAISDTNTAIYSIAFSTTRSEEKQEAAGFSSNTPGPPGGCMAKDHSADPTTSDNRAMQAYDCLSELLPPLRLAKMAFLAARDGLRKNIPETVAQLTGGEYFKLTNAKSLDRSLQTISNHLPNRYVLSFQPQSPHPGLHALTLTLKDYPNLTIKARGSYWADTDPNTPAAEPAP